MSKELARATLVACRTRGEKIVTAESCTGGMVSAALTAIAGSSDVVERGFVTYSNEAKMQMLGVRDATLKEFGAVSEDVAAEMAAGALQHARYSCDAYRDVRLSVLQCPHSHFGGHVFGHRTKFFERCGTNA